VLARTSNNLAVSQLITCEPVASQQKHELGITAISIVGSRYQAMTNEDIEGLVCCS
jgi:hypothetical protein